MNNGMISMQDVNFRDMTNEVLEKTLYNYSESRKGEIADLTRAAAIRIGVLAARVMVLETDKLYNGRNVIELVHGGKLKDDIQIDGQMNMFPT